MEILIEELDHSLWAAATEKGRLEGLDVDPATEEVRWGSIYWAKVARIDKSLDAAFVNLDGENIGLLHNADVRIQQKDGTWQKGGKDAIGKVLEPGQMIAVQAKSGYLPKGEADEFTGDKNPRISMNITLPGRYLIYAPMEGKNRISQRIHGKKMRAQLMEMLDSLNSCDGCILRAAAAHTQTDILARESKILLRTWEQLQTFFDGEEPQLLMLGPDSIQRALSDNANAQISKIEITTMEHFQDVEAWCELFAPDLVTKIKPVEIPPGKGNDLGLFGFRDIVSNIEELLQPYVIMMDGGSLVIEETAALTAIDVNRGADKASVTELNKKAAMELARQIRLRNLGGAIVVDFLKMKAKKEQQALLDVLTECFDNDPCTVQLHGITGLGFVEITRHRRTPPLLDRFESAVGELI